jgi:hypothetical protein
VAPANGGLSFRSPVSNHNSRSLCSSLLRPYAHMLQTLLGCLQTLHA